MIDCHVHLLGDGSSGSGCELKLTALSHKILARIILSMMQLPASTLNRNLNVACRDKMIQILEQYPNLYLDNSALNTPLRSKHFTTLLREPFAGRVIHGSDFPIPISSRWIRLRRMIKSEEARKINYIQNIFDRDIQTKKALGFSADSFTKLYSLLPTKALQ